MADTTTYNNTSEAIEAIAMAIEAGGAAHRAEYDLEAIFAGTHGDYARGYRLMVDADAFWEAVERHCLLPDGMTLVPVGTWLPVGENGRMEDVDGWVVLPSAALAVKSLDYWVTQAVTHGGVGRTAEQAVANCRARRRTR